MATHPYLFGAVARHRVSGMTRRLTPRMGQWGPIWPATAPGEVLVPMASMEMYSRSVDLQQNAAAEQARTRLDAGLREWSGQRTALAADGLGRNPLRRVPRSWPEVAATRVEVAAREACVIDEQGAHTEASRLLWSATAKLVGAAVSLAIPLSILIALVVGS